MKYIKMLGLAVMAAMAVMAFGAGSASATKLCTDTACTVDYAAGTKIVATSPHTQLTASFGTVTCTKNEVAGKTSNTGGAAETVFGPVESLVFESCNGPVKVLKNGSLEVHTVNPHTALLTSKGAEVTVELFGIHCIYGTSAAGTSLGHVTGGETPLVHIKATVERKEGGRGGAFCPTTAVWEGTYTVTSPHALYFG